MVDPFNPLRERVEAALHSAFGSELATPADGADPVDPALHRSAHADYQCDAAMGLARRLKRNPRQIGTAIAEHLRPDDVIASAEVSGPGFVNLTLRDEFLTAALTQMLGDERLGLPRPEHPQTVVVDYSSPNLAKEMHVGHLRSTIIGDALVRMLEARGHRVLRQNHIGDWGVPFGMLIEHMLDEQLTKQGAGVHELSGFYRSARKKFDREPAFADRARRRVVLLQSGDEDTLGLWRQLIDVTLEHLAALYSMLDVTLEHEHIAGESMYNPELHGVVEELQRLGIARDSEGAVCVFPPGFLGRDEQPLPLIVRKSDGGFGYPVTDLAAVRYRIDTLHADRVLYVVGSPQHQHLAMVYATAKMAGWVQDERVLEHVEFGSVLGPDKKMLKTRAGESISLRALLEEAIERARALVDEKSPQLPESQRADIAKAVGVGAVKYFDLVNDRIKDYVFDWDRMLSFDGNTAPYLMYAHARLRSVIARAAADNGEAGEDAAIGLVEPSERALAMELVHFGSNVDKALETMHPHRLCRYLYELAGAAMTFYERCPVLKAEGPVRASRLRLCLLTADVLQRGLGLLGISAPETM